MNEETVLQAYSAPSGEIDSRFDGYHVSRGKLLRLSRCEARPFVDFQSHPVTQAVDESPREWTESAGRCVMGPAAYAAGAEGISARPVGPEDSGVNPLLSRSPF